VLSHAEGNPHEGFRTDQLDWEDAQVRLGADDNMSTISFPEVPAKDVGLVDAVTARLTGVGSNVAKVKDLGPEVTDASKEVSACVFGALKEATSGNMGKTRFQGLNEQVFLATFENVKTESEEYWKTHQAHLEAKGWTWTDRQDDGRTIKGFRSACLDTVSNLRIKMVWISYAFGAGTIKTPEGVEIDFRRDAWNYIKQPDATLHGVYKSCEEMLLTHCLPNLSQRFRLNDLDSDGDPRTDKDGKKITVEYSFTSSEDMDSYQDQLAEVEELVEDGFAAYSEVTEAQELLGRMKEAMVKSFKDQDAFKGLIIDGRSIAKIRKLEAAATREAEELLRSAEETAASKAVAELLENGASVAEVQAALEIVREAQAEKVSA